MTLVNVKKCIGVVNRNRTMDKESLNGSLGLGDRAQSVLSNATSIVKNKAAMSENGASARIVAKAKENIANCTGSIKGALETLGANDKEKSEIVAVIEKGDMEQVRYHLLKILVRRNPGMYARRLAIAEKQMQH